MVFTYFCIPETKGLSLEQIDLLYENSTPITSARYRQQLVADGDLSRVVERDDVPVEEDKGGAAWEAQEIKRLEV